jgi:hypothetical protein
MRKIKLFLQLPASGKMMFVETCWYSLYAAWLLGRSNDYRKIAGILGRVLPVLSPEKRKNEQQVLKTVRMAGSAIDTIAKYTPWRNVCYHRAIQAKLLLNRRGIPIQVRIGFKKNEHGTIEGHAWTKYGTRMITGACSEKEYVILTEFQ